jgi:hypothetical protein
MASKNWLALDPDGTPLRLAMSFEQLFQLRLGNVESDLRCRTVNRELSACQKLGALLIALRYAGQELENVGQRLGVLIRRR